MLNRCDVIIVNFNAGGFLTGAIKSVLRSKSVAHVYVVDNASTDGSLDLVPEGHNDRLTIIRNTVNLGFASACNLALKRAVSENMLLLNPDCCVREGAVERLITALRSVDHIGMVGPLLLNGDGSEQAAGRRRLPTPSRVLAASLPRLPAFRSLGFLLHHDPLPDGPVEVEAISGACMMVRREMIADIGLLDEGYFLHCEDLDWCMRVWWGDWKVLFVPDAKVVHHKGISSRTRLLAVEYYKHAGMVRFYRKLLCQVRPRWLVALVAVAVWTRFGGITTLHLFSQLSKSLRDNELDWQADDAAAKVY
jgi:GT2 family glycosyltransferase